MDACPFVVTCACWVVGHWEKCHLPLYLWPETASVLMGTATLIYTFWRLVQAPCKPSCSCLWACSRWPVTATLQDLPGGFLEWSSLMKLGSCLGEDRVALHTIVDMAGKEFVIASDDLALRAKSQECPMFSWGGVLSTTNAQQSVMTGMNACWDCWGICWWVWWGSIPDATTLLFWAMDWAAELDLSQLQPTFCPYKNISRTLRLFPTRCHVSGRPLCIPSWVCCRCFYASSNLTAEALLLKVLEPFASPPLAEGCLSCKSKDFLSAYSLLCTKASWISAWRNVAEVNGELLRFISKHLSFVSFRFFSFLEFPPVFVWEVEA